MPSLMTLSTPPIPMPEASVCNIKVSSLSGMVRVAVLQTAPLRDSKALFIWSVQTTLTGALLLVAEVSLAEWLAQLAMNDL